MMCQFYLSFLRYSLSVDNAVPNDIECLDWHGLFDFGKKQGLLGVLFQGIKRLPRDIAPKGPLLMQWVAATQRIRDQNNRMNTRCVELQSILAKDGFDSCVLKGQGLTKLYPEPASRTPGDIDVWVWGAKDDKKVYPDRRRICRYVESITPKQTVRYHHIDFPIYEDIPVEVHFMPSYMFAPWHNKKLQRWFESNSSELRKNMVIFNTGEMTTPTEYFNLVFILNHLYRHVFSEGIGLRQLVDYYFVLTNSSSEQRVAALKDITSLGMLKFASAVMWIMHDVLGLDESYLLTYPNEKEGQFLLNEVLVGGNFGQNDTRLGNKINECKLKRYIRMTVRNLHWVRHYPSEALCEPLFRTKEFLWRLFWKVLFI